MLALKDRAVGGWPPVALKYARRRAAAEAEEEDGREDWRHDKRQFDAWRLEQRNDAPPPEDMEEEQPSRLRWRVVFPDPLDQVAARQFGALSAREDRVLSALLEPTKAPVLTHPIKPSARDFVVLRAFQTSGRAFSAGAHVRRAQAFGWRNVGAMVRTGFLSPPGAAIPAGEPAAQPDGLRRIALKAACSERIVREVLKTLGRRFVNGNDTPKPRDGWSRPGTLKVVTRARRQRDYYVCREDRIGAWREQYWELLSSTEARAALKTASRDHVLRESRERRIRTSPMRNLWEALAHAMTRGETRRPTTLAGVTLREWRGNLEWARRRVRAFRTLFGQRESGPLTFVQALDALAKGCNPCRTCRTPLLRGCRLQGKAVTRAREDCDDACRMEHMRRGRARGR